MTSYPRRRRQPRPAGECGERGASASGTPAPSAASCRSTDLRFGQLLCSRLCHDLVGPAGAVNAGLELLDGGDRAGTLDLLRTSGKRLARQLAFFRLVFGRRGGREMENLTEARDVASGMLAGGKVTLDWSSTAARDQAPADFVRLVLSLVLMASEALPRGGRVRAAVHDVDGPEPAVVEAVGQGATLSERSAAAVRSQTPVADLDARTVHADYAAHLAEICGAAIDIDNATSDGLRFTVRRPAGS